MRYFPLTPGERREMLEFIGVKDVKELFSDLPGDKSFHDLSDLPAGLDEKSLLRKFSAYAGRNRHGDYLSFLGAGAYQHFIPEVVNSLTQRGEFVTPYTPYQPEVSQGSLQAVFEYQTMMTMLTGMDVANSSLYDGGTAAVEALLMAARKKGGRRRMVLAASLHPEYREIIETYLQNFDFELVEALLDPADGRIDTADLAGKINQDTIAVLFQSPNFFGVVEEAGRLTELAHAAGAYAIQVVTEAMSLPFLQPPGKYGVDVVVGEAQSFGLPLSFGGPYLGFMAAAGEFLRQLPGRLVGQTVDRDGKRGYVLTLSTREQHIKREKATSNICSNQALCAVRAAVYLAAMGPQGLHQVASANHRNTCYFVESVTALPGVSVRYPRNFFNEVVLDLKQGNALELLSKIQERCILAGIPLQWFHEHEKSAFLLNFTEMHEKEDIDRLVAALGELT